MAKKIIIFLIIPILIITAIIFGFLHKNTNKAEGKRPELSGSPVIESSNIPKDNNLNTPKGNELCSIPPTFTASPAAIGIPNNVPVLMYHAVEEDPHGLKQLYVRTSEFEKQIRYLAENGYTPILFDELKNFKNFKKPVLITFDDGYSDNYSDAYPILIKYKCRAAIFLIVNFVGSPGYLNTAQVKEMADIVSFQSHTVNHIDLRKANEATLEYECSKSKKSLEDLTGKKVIALCYPAGSFNKKIINIASKYYDYAVTTKPGHYTSQKENYTIKRIRIQRTDTIEDFKRKLNNSTFPP